MKKKLLKKLIQGEALGTLLWQDARAALKEQKNEKERVSQGEEAGDQKRMHLTGGGLYLPRR